MLRRYQMLTSLAWLKKPAIYSLICVAVSDGSRRAISRGF
jgi:hypothetical protein